MAPPRDAERAEREAARTAAPVASLERPRVGAGGWIRTPNKAGLVTVRQAVKKNETVQSNREKVVGNITLGGVAEVREELGPGLAVGEEHGRVDAGGHVGELGVGALGVEVLARRGRRVGDDAPHARGLGGAEPDEGVLDDDAGAAVDAEALRREVVDLGVGLLVRDVVARDDAVELREPRPGQEKGAKFSTSKAPISVVFRSFRLIFGRAIISRSALEAGMLFPKRARAEHSR
jgi:hypothetical protein